MSLQGAFGRAALGITSLVTYIGLGLGVLGSGLALPFGLYILIVQRSPEAVLQDSVTAPSSSRQVRAGRAVVVVSFDSGVHPEGHPMPARSRCLRDTCPRVWQAAAPSRGCCLGRRCRLCFGAVPCSQPLHTCAPCHPSGATGCQLRY